MRQENQRRAEMFYDVLFDKQFDDGGTMIGVAEKRMFKMSPLHLLNVTYGSGESRTNPGGGSPLILAITIFQPNTRLL